VHVPTRFEHAHPPVRNVNEIEVERLTFGQRAVLDHLSSQDEALTKIVETLATRVNGGSQD